MARSLNQEHLKVFNLIFKDLFALQASLNGTTFYATQSIVLKGIIMFLWSQRTAK